MKFDYKVSHRADRTELLKNPPTYSETFQKIEDTKMTKEERAMFGLALLTGARISEILGTKQKDIKIYGMGNQVIDPKDTNNYQLCAPHEIQKLIITLANKKSKKQKFKQVPIINNAIFSRAIGWIIERLVEEGYNPDMRVVTFKRTQAWWRVKRRMGDDWFCHMTRHVVASNDVRAGINPGVLKSKLGWSNLSPYGAYVHLDVGTIQEELKRIYGDQLEKYNQAVGDSTTDRALKKPLSPTQLLGAYAAAAEVKEITTPLPMGNIQSAFKRESVVVQGGKKEKIYLGREAREIKKKIQESGILNKPSVEIITPKTVPLQVPKIEQIKKPVIIPVKKKELDDVLQVV